MKNLFLLVFSFVLFIIPGWSSAQELSSTEIFLSSRKPALLFEIRDFGLDQYEGGIGMALSGPDQLLWRFSVRGSYNNQTSFESNEHRTRENDRTNWTLGAVFTPTWIIPLDERFVVNLGPSFGYQYGSNVNNSQYMEDGVSTVYRQSNHFNNLLVGVNAGVGITISGRILLLAEYAPQGEYLIYSNSDDEDAVLSGNIYENESFQFSNRVVFTLCFKL